MTTSPDRPGARLALAGVTKAYGHVLAVDDVGLDLEPGSFTSLLGPSGCGKSTLLGLVSGLVAPDRGSLELDGHPLVGPPDARPDVGLVFQKPLLFPHLTVLANVAFGLRMRRRPPREVRAAAHAMLEQVQLDGLAERRVTELSGGQEQRVALARALVLEPRLLLLDEPFSQLDALLRANMRELVRRLTRDAGVTSLFVTHDRAEAVEVADGIALMLDGRLAGHAPPETFYARPPSLAAARFFGVTNEIVGTVREGIFRNADGQVSQAVTVDRDGAAVLVVRPEALWLETGGRERRDSPRAHRLAGVVSAARFAGAHAVVEIEIARIGRLTVHAPTGTQIALGSSVTVCVPYARGTVLAAD